ncbi:MAG TPA: NrsF family protein [Xanthobacteraceae bacterium]|nr:NrsF family protein [Xanthobacteraceae bacterium]
MRTDDLVQLLVKDSVPWRFRSVLAAAVAGGIIIVAILFFAAIGFRPDISEAVKSDRFLFKFVVTIALAVTALWVTFSVSRPGGSLTRRGLALAIAPALLAGAALVELLVLPQSQWMPNLVGHNARFCLTLIPLLSIGPLACLLVALREGAPSSPGLAGAVAGLAASGIGATFYAANCTDDSALFVIAWYPLAILIVTTAGYLIGRKLLRW